MARAIAANALEVVRWLTRALRRKRSEAQPFRNIIEERFMSNMHDDKLEAMLKARQIEPASPDLAKWIILKAQAIPQRTTVSRS